MKKQLGYAFWGKVNKVTAQNTNFKQKLDEGWTDLLIPNFDPEINQPAAGTAWRITALVIFIGVAYFGLFLRLFHLQIAYGQKNRELAEGNRIQIKVIHAPRGVIYDRNGKLLAANSPAFRLIDEVSKKVRFISREEALNLEVKGDPAVAKLEVDSSRFYPKKEETAHVLGYVGEISASQLTDPKVSGLKMGDVIGQSGIEDYYESVLRGKDGGEIIEVDAAGKKVRTLRTTKAISGNNIFLTIDLNLQEQLYLALKAAVEASRSCCGAAVAMDPGSGQILALVSYPSFDPNVFTQERDEEQITEILTRPDAPILNRVIGGVYPPGSTYKILSSIAALKSGKISPDTQIEDTGETYLGPYRFTNWYFSQYGKTEGAVNLVKALKRSNDTYFYRVGEMVGEDTLAEWSRKLNLGDRLGIDLAGESTGLIPDQAWKLKQFNTSWYPGDTLHMAIGQGFVLVTPLQVLGYTSFIASDGNLYKPQLVLKTTSPDSEILKQFQPEVLVSHLLRADQIKVIREGLKEAASEGGTAWPLFNFPLQTAGKTGTAEYGDPKGKTHAWYTGFAPFDDPKIVVTALVEGGGEGSTVASPIVKKAFSYFFNIKDETPIASSSARSLGE